MGKKSKKLEIKWRRSLTKDDITAATTELTLQLDPGLRKHVATLLKTNSRNIQIFKAIDILRVARVHPMEKKKKNVADKMIEIKAGKELVPCILVHHNNALYIADGFHRISACFHLNEAAEIACVLVFV